MNFGLTFVCTMIYPTGAAIPSSSFDWDHGNRKKCRKHGVSIADIEAMFLRPIAVVPDPKHSKKEERFKASERTKTGGTS